MAQSGFTERCIMLIAVRIPDMTGRAIGRFSARFSNRSRHISDTDVGRMVRSDDVNEREKGLAMMLGNEDGLLKLATQSQYLDVRLSSVRMLQNKESLAYVIFESECPETKALALELQIRRI